MSRIGKKPVPVGKAKVAIAGQKINVEGPKGKLALDVHPLIKVKQADGNLLVERPDDEKQSKALHGLTRALLANMIEGVTNGYKKSLEIQGVGYKAEMRGKNLVLSVGYFGAKGGASVLVNGGSEADIVIGTSLGGLGDRNQLADRKSVV